jgi:hypothetical protein
VAHVGYGHGTVHFEVTAVADEAASGSRRHSPGAFSSRGSTKAPISGKLDSEPGIGPDKLFACTFRFNSFTRLPSEDGMLPVSLFVSMVNRNMFVSSPICDGIVPDKLHFENDSHVSAVILPISVGIVPVISGL